MKLIDFGRKTRMVLVNDMAERLLLIMSSLTHGFQIS